MKKYLAECIGTMFLVLLACGSAVLAGPKIGVLGIGPVSYTHLTLPTIEP